MHSDGFRSATRIRSPKEAGSLCTSSAQRRYRRRGWCRTCADNYPRIFVAYPHIAQSTTNKSQITFTDEIISDPKPDSVNIELHSILTIHSSYHPTLYSFPGDFYLEGRDKPFATIQIPQIKADNGSTAIAKQTYQITDMEEFTAYTEAVLGLEEYTVTLLGRGGVKQGGLPKTHVNYNKSSTVKGKHCSLLRSVIKLFISSLSLKCLKSTKGPCLKHLSRHPANF